MKNCAANPHKCILCAEYTQNNLFGRNKNNFKSADQVEFLQLIYKFSCQKV